MNKSQFVPKILLLALTVALILTLLPVFMPAALAADYEVASQQDLITALNAGDAVTITTTSDFTINCSIIIPNDCTLEIGHAIIINGGDSMTVNNGRVAINSNGSIFINNGSKMVNGGMIYNDGVIDNIGTINNDKIIFSCGMIINENTIVNRGAITNGGPAGNIGTITNVGTIDNIGTILNDRGSTIDNIGTITNSGTISNFYRIDNGGVITNNNGSITNHDNGTFTGFPSTGSGTSYNSSSTSYNNSSTSYNNNGTFIDFPPRSSGNVHNSFTFTATDIITILGRMLPFIIVVIIGLLAVAAAKVFSLLLRIRMVDRMVENTIQILKKRDIVPFIECLILSSLFLMFIVSELFLLWTIVRIRGLSGMLQNYWHWTSSILLIAFMIILISNFIFYFVLKKKYNFEMKAFLYGVGFTSSCVTFALLTQVGFVQLGFYNPFRDEGIYYQHLCYILLFTFLYYSYATFLRNKEKEVSRVTLGLTAATVISFAVLIISEIIQYQIPTTGIIPFLFVLYLAYCLIHKKGILNLREFTWSPFFPSWIVFWCVLIYAIITIPF